MSSYYEKMLATGEVKCIDEEIPFEIPQGWEWCRVTDVMLKITDGTHRSPTNTDSGDFMYITAKNIKEDGISLANITFVSKDVHDEIYSRCNPEYGDLLYIKDGATTGIVTINNIKKPFSLLSSVALLKPTSEINTNYILFFLRTPLNLESVRSSMKGCAITRITLRQIEKWLVPVPPYEEQQRIVSFIKELLPCLDKYSSLQMNLDLLNVNINDKLKKSILQEAIQGKLVQQIAEEGTAQELLEQIKEEKRKLVREGKLKKSALNDSVIFRGDDNKYWEKKGTTCECIDEDIPFDVPKSWAWVRLETILNIGSARRVHAKDWRQAGIPFYRAREIGKLADDGFVDNELYIDLSLYEDFSSSGVPLPNDLMITAVGTLGKVYIVKESDKFYYKDGSVLCLANKYRLCAEYLKMVIESPFFKGQYRQESQGTTVATLTMVRLQKYFIPIPPLQEQYRIVETYRNIASIMSR